MRPGMEFEFNKADELFIMAIIPSKFFLTRGKGVHEKDMLAFELALRECGVHQQNHVKISSIIPPGCQRITRQQGIRLLKPGQVCFSVIAQSETNEPGQIISAGIGLAQPKDENLHGYLTELEEIIGRTEKDVAKDVEEMAIENLVTEWGYQYNESVVRLGKKNYRLHNRDVMADSLVQTAQGADKNLYTVVLVMAVFIY